MSKRRSVIKSLVLGSLGTAIFPKIISCNMLCIHRSTKITLNKIWKKFEITDSNYHPLKKVT